MSRTQRYQLNPHKFLLPHELLALNSLLVTRLDRDALILKLMLATGARASEMLELRAEDLNHHDMEVYVRGLKGSNDREIPLTAALFAELAAYAKDKIGTLFPISLRRLEQIWHENRPVNKKLHSLRHTFAIELYKRTRDLRAVQVALGHRSINNTMIYADYVYQKDELRKIIIPA